MKKTNVLDIISLLLAVLFAYASYNKLITFQTFKVQLMQSPITVQFSNEIAWILPAVEICTTVALLLGLSIRTFRTIGMLASFFLMTLFTAYIYLLLHFSFYVPCSCGGILSGLTWNQHLIFNVIMLLVTLSGIILLPGKNKKTGYIPTKPNISYGIASAVIAIVGLNSFTVKNSNNAAGWRLSPLGWPAAKTGNYSPFSFPESFGSTAPFQGVGQSCSTDNTVVCGAYFTIMGTNKTDPFSGLNIVTGTHQN